MIIKILLLLLFDKTYISFVLSNIYLKKYYLLYLMETITINDIEYINSEDVFIKAPIYCKDSRNGRELIKNKKITDFIYAKPLENKWIISNGKSYKYDKILLLKSFVDTIQEISNPIVIDDKYEVAPDIIHLENHEKFKDNDGNIIEIETRGNRKVNNIYFKVKDVMIGFEMDNIITTIIDKRKNDGYCENIHYKYFNCKLLGFVQKITIKKELYLTYEGILRVLFASHNKKVKQFISWATETLFTCQLGEQEDKELLSSNLLGVSIKAVKQVFNKNISTVPCIYLLNLNTVEKLRTTLNISNNYSDDMIVCKFGCTKDIEQRIKDHTKTYGKIQNVELNLLMFSYIDPLFVFEAEINIKDYLYQYLYKYESYNELIIINPKQIKQIKNQYDMIQNKYSGHIKELLLQIKELENKLILNETNTKIIEEQLLAKNNSNELKTSLLIEQHKNELLIEKHKNEIKDKDIQLLEYKIKFLELNK